MLELKSKGGYGCPKMDRVCQMGLVMRAIFCFSEMIPSPFIVSAASRHRSSRSRGVWDSPARWSCQALLVAALRNFCRCSHPSAKATWGLRVMFWRWGGGDVFDGPSLFCGCFVANLPQVVADAVLSLFKADVFFRYLNASFAEEFEDVCVFNSRYEERSFPCFRIDGKPFFCSKAGGDALLAAEIFGGRAHGWGRNEFFISGGCFL